MSKYFGTDGIRGTYGSALMNESFAQKVGQAIGAFLKTHCPDDPTVAIASDTRPSGPSLKQALIEGLCGMGVKIIDFGVAPTPALSFGVLKHNASFGVMITASHNPFGDNGIKCFTDKGTKLRIEQELEIEHWIDQSHPVSQPQEAPTHDSIHQEYLNNLQEYFCQLDLTGIKIALDTANGATCKTTQSMLENLGATVFGIHQGNGMINEGCGSEHLDSLKKLVHQKNADVGIAHDGDGDRVRFVDADGKVIDGDQILGLLALHAHRNQQLESSTFVATVHSNSGLFAFLNNHAIHGKASDVGDRNVYLKMLEEKSNWGGESSGHIICTDYLPTGDGLFAALSVLKVMQDQSKPLSSLAHDIKLWPSLSGSFPVSEKIPIDRIPELTERISTETSLLKEEGRILLRYSGTEPKIRLLVEGKSIEKITPSYQRLQVAIEKSL